MDFKHYSSSEDLSFEIVKCSISVRTAFFVSLIETDSLRSLRVAFNDLLQTYLQNCC